MKTTLELKPIEEKKEVFIPKKGILLKSISHGFVILCDSVIATDNIFSGVVIHGNGHYSRGSYSTIWATSCFEEIKQDAIITFKYESDEN